MVTTERRSLEEVLLFVDKKKHTLLFIHKAIINGYLILTSGCYHILFLFFERNQSNFDPFRFKLTKLYQNVNFNL